MKYTKLLLTVSLVIGCSFTCVQSSASSYIRLGGGSTANAGKVEIFYDGEWGTICNTGSLSSFEGDVMCRELGFAGFEAELNPFVFETGTEQIWMENPSCISRLSESIVLCGDIAIDFETSCSHFDDIAIRCDPTTLTPFTGDVRLVDGDSAYEGRVEVFINDEWGTVCSDLFFDAEVEVVCNQLGFEVEGFEGERSVTFPTGTGEIWLTELQCVGNENNLLDCDRLRDIGDTGLCSHTKDVGVKCVDPNAIRANTVDDSDFEFIDFLLSNGVFIFISFFILVVFCSAVARVAKQKQLQSFNQGNFNNPQTGVDGNVGNNVNYNRRFGLMVVGNNLAAQQMASQQPGGQQLTARQQPAQQLPVQQEANIPVTQPPNENIQESGIYDAAEFDYNDGVSAPTSFVDQIDFGRDDDKKNEPEKKKEFWE